MWKNYEKTYKKCTKPAYIQPESLEGNFKKKKEKVRKALLEFNQVAHDDPPKAIGGMFRYLGASKKRHPKPHQAFTRFPRTMHNLRF